MRYLLLLVLLLAIPLGAEAQTCITIPDAGQENVCENYRISTGFTEDGWDREACYTEMVLDRSRLLTADAAAILTTSVISATRAAAADGFDNTHPSQQPMAACGDGVLDPSFGEECDDGNLTNGDGCSDTCRIE